jgi:poly-gamma-glutamate capsule biosynthesis protein CapA/YwtB (metallophosphatase superfamily)
MKAKIHKLTALTLSATLVLAANMAAGKSPGPWDSASNAKNMVFAAVGDSLIMTRLSQSYQPNTGEMFDLIRKADVTFTNFETGVHGFDIPGGQESGGTYMNSPPFAPDELTWAGFKLVGLANNHANDFGIEGLRQTMAALNKSKLVWAGVGENLALARRPAYLDTPKGRVALISTTSSYPAAIMAGPQRKDMPGRPGVSFLRHSTTYTVPQETFDTLKKLAGDNANSGFDDAGSSGDAGLSWAGARYVVGAQVGAITTHPNKVDLAELVAEVKDAKQQAEWVMVSIHCHESASPAEREKPPQFEVEFAHAMIDAGADIFVAHGPHVLRGVEVYKGKPIFYSLANFIMENDLVELQPQDNYDKTGLSDTASPSEYFSKRSKNDTIGFPSDRKFWQSVVAEAVFNPDHSLKEIRLHPISMGFGQIRSRRGQPYPAPPAEEKQIVDDLKALCAQFGTTVEDRNGVIVVSWKQ